MTDEEELEVLHDNSTKVKEFLDYIIDGLLGDKSILHRSTAKVTPEGDVILDVVADPNFVSRLIGKGGHIANSIRDLVRSKGRITGNLSCSVYIMPISGRRPDKQEPRHE